MLGLDFIGKDVDAYLTEKSIRRKTWSEENVIDFSRRAGYAISLIFREKEIILFSLLQWLVIGLVYYLWVQLLGWIPPEVWQSDSDLNDLALNLAFLAWSFFCVALAAYPIGVLTGAMGAAHFLRQQGFPSTIAGCLKMALPNSHRLWLFQTVDGWLTVDRILDRLPKKDYFTSMARRALDEAIYYAWKVGTLGVVPALLTGKGLIDAGKDSINLVKTRTSDVLKLRGGYSVTCWLIGITTYIGSILYFVSYPSLFEGYNSVYTFYLWMGVPILISVGVIQLFVRPIYVLASCHLYSEYLQEQDVTLELKGSPGPVVSTFVAFLVLGLLLAVVYVYREEIGLMAILRVHA